MQEKLKMTFFSFMWGLSLYFTARFPVETPGSFQLLKITKFWQ